MTTERLERWAEALRAGAALRASAGALRQDSRLARGASARLRHRNQAAVQQAHTLRDRSQVARASVAPAASSHCWPDQELRLSLAEFTAILTEAHHYTGFEAMLEVTAELVRHDLPAECSELSGPQALEFIDRILRRRS